MPSRRLPSSSTMRRGTHSRAAYLGRAAVTSFVASALLALLFGMPACADDAAKTCDPEGGPVAGDADLHCGTKVVVLAPDACTAEDDGGPAEVDPRYNGEGEDDDCKYHVTWTATNACFEADAYFEITLSSRFGNAPQVGAAPRIEGHLANDVGHTLVDADQRSVELGGGRYRVGPVRFDATGEWVVTFHLYEDCNHTESSPRGSISFLVDVP
ncbi:MAG: hypothetical protein EP329_00565 [Deltaproteobacteria bacterium]|nr:MAG: hypothetical protein EP329_00565 [Deltaproteobacteria bacterium]